MFLVNKHFFRLSFVCALGCAVAVPVHAELKINPYPNQPLSKSSVKAEPIDLVLPPIMQQELPAPSIEQEFEDLHDIVDEIAQERAPQSYAEQDFRAEMVGESASAVSPSSATVSSAPSPLNDLPLLRMDDLDKSAPQSGLYVPRRAVNTPLSVAPTAIKTQSRPVQKLVNVESAAAAPQSLFATTKSWDERPSRPNRPIMQVAPAPIAQPDIDLVPIVTTPPSELLLEEPATFKPVIERVAEVPKPKPNDKWNTFAGANVRETLDVWSKDAGVELIWADRDTEFDVRSTIFLETTYEAAVQALLEQYDSSRIRPVGSLHVDAASGARTLLIQVLEEG